VLEGLVFLKAVHVHVGIGSVNIDVVLLLLVDTFQENVPHQ